MNDTIIPPEPVAAPGSTFEMHGAPSDVSKLITALGKARATMKAPVADTTGQFQNRTFKYADLGSIYDVAIPSLSREGVTVFHPNCQVDTDTQRACTVLAGFGAMLIISHDYRATVSPENVKAHGSMMTYLNRYQIRGLCALSGDDDADNDGKQGTAPFRSQPKPAAPPQGNRTRARDPEAEVPQNRPQQPQPSTDGPLDDSDVDDKAPLVINSPTANKLTAALEANGYSERPKRDEFILGVTGKDRSPGSKSGPLTYGDARKLLAALEKVADVKEAMR